MYSINPNMWLIIDRQPNCRQLTIWPEFSTIEGHQTASTGQPVYISLLHVHRRRQPEKNNRSKTIFFRKRQGHFRTLAIIVSYSWGCSWFISVRFQCFCRQFIYELNVLAYFIRNGRYNNHISWLDVIRLFSNFFSLMQISRGLNNQNW